MYMEVTADQATNAQVSDEQTKQLMYRWEMETQARNAQVRDR